jgi:hypothetical protein
MSNQPSMPWTFDEVPFEGELIALECQITFDCDPGDRWTPPHCAIDQVFVIPPGNMSESVELDSLADDLARQHADEIVAEFSERQADIEEAARDDYHDRKRDELRGC